VLEAFRARGEPVLHRQHVWDALDATFMRPGTAAVEIHPDVAPAGDEPVLEKAEPNGVGGAAVHAAFMAALADGYATVVGADQLVEGSTTSV
jgi:hypothetical protein